MMARRGEVCPSSHTQQEVELGAEPTSFPQEPKRKYQGPTAAANRGGTRRHQALGSRMRPSARAAPFKERWAFLQGSSLNFSLEACHRSLQPAAG